MKDPIFWILIGMFILWIVLKGIDVIQSPLYVELFPPTVIMGLLIYLSKDLKNSYEKLSDKIDKNNEIILKRLENMMSIFERQSGKTELLLDITKGMVKTSD